MPTGSIPLEAFIKRNRARLYPHLDHAPMGVAEGCRPVNYQRVLHMVSAVSFLHVNEIVPGDLSMESCRLS